jgi:hypothetical protein
MSPTGYTVNPQSSDSYRNTQQQREHERHMMLKDMYYNQRKFGNPGGHVNGGSSTEGISIKWYFAILLILPLTLFVVASYLTFGIVYVFSSPYKRTIHQRKFDVFKKEVRNWLDKVFKKF